MTRRAERLGLESVNIHENDGSSAVDRKVQHSIAISLKRIADALERPAPVYSFDNRFGGQP